jgi:steroid delta-isomerase-like uncharacterized protein
MSALADLRPLREAVVRRHMESENTLDFDTALETFAHPRYELMGTGQIFDGAEQVMHYYRASRAGFPDQRNDNVVLRHADDAVIAEFDLHGTHLGTFLGHAPTGRTFTVRMIALFLFDDGARIVCERVYFDSAAITRQLGLTP